jgi:hypothetical protein
MQRQFDAIPSTLHAAPSLGFDALSAISADVLKRPETTTSARPG